MRNHAPLLAVALSLSASGCSLIVDPEAKEPLETVEGYCNSIQDVFARKIQECEPVDPGFLESMLTAWRSGCENLGAADARYGYDVAVAKECIATLKNASCTEEDLFGTMFEFCALAVPGKVPAGASCYQPDSLLNECAGGGTCSFGAGTVGSCPGTCVVPGALNQPCAVAGEPCANGLVCDGTNTCRPPGSGGEPCDGTNPPCDDRYYYCATSTSPVVCQSLPYDGWRCEASGYRCYTGYNCVQNQVDFLYYCVPPTPLGGDCSRNGCVGGTYCRWADAPPTCHIIPSVPNGAGGDCGWGGSSDCLDGLYCDNADGTCQPTLALGGSCTSDSQCGAGVNCSRLSTEPTGTCAAFKAKGKPCRVGARECLDGLWCEGANVGATGVCRGTSGTGGPCGTVNEEYPDCAVGFFCDAGTCAANAGVGDPCSSYSECGYPFSGAVCDQDIASPTWQTCVANACTAIVGWFPGAG